MLSKFKILPLSKKRFPPIHKPQLLQWYILYPFYLKYNSHVKTILAQTQMNLLSHTVERLL
jgi:hypothetical protein